MKIAVVCDIHMPDNINSFQNDFFMRAVSQMKKDGIKTVIGLGDVSAMGEKAVIDRYKEALKSFDSHFVLGNKEASLQNEKDVFLEVGERHLLAINSPKEALSADDRKKIEDLRDGDILLMHHGLHVLGECDCGFITRLMLQREITLIHAHSHKWFDYQVGKGRVLGLRALDPDKSLGNFPCITYIDISDEKIETEEKIFDVPLEVILDARKHFGLSCVDNHKDVEYATQNKVGFIELRCNGGDWFPDMTLLPKLKKWREETNGYLSVHMPNLKWDGEQIKGADKWSQATDYAIKVGADGLTMHPPRVLKADMPQNGSVWNLFKELYVNAVKSVGDNVKIGIENLHMTDGEQSISVDESKLHFGYIPDEVALWIDAVNNAVENPNRVGHVFDIGHARNNGNYASIYPSSRWFELLGKKTVAFHIHQVISTAKGAINHTAIENWFGPLVSYTSFFYAWSKNTINHVPVFLEVQGRENFEKSVRAFENTFKKI